MQFSTSCSNIVYRLGYCKKIEIDIFGRKYNDENIDEIPYECSGGDIITEGILCRFVKES